MIDTFLGVARYAKQDRFILAVLILGLCIESAFDVAFRYSLKFLIDDAIATREIDTLGIILAALAVAAIAFNIIVIGCDYIWARNGGRILNNIRCDLFAHLQHLPVSFYRRTSTGDLTTRFNADIAQVEGGMVHGLPTALMAVVEVLITVSLLASMHYLLFLLACTGILLVLLIPRLMQRRALDASSELRRQEGRMIGDLQENLSAHSVIKAYGLETHASRLFAMRLDAVLAALIRSNFLSFLISRLPSLALLLLQLLAIGLGGWLAISEEISIGELVAFITLLIGLNNAMFTLAWTIPYFIDATAGWKRVREILDEPVPIADHPNATDLPPFSRIIELDRVTFRYENRATTTLDDVSLEIKAGQFVAIVGRSGAGKSSILNLIMRFFEVGEGRVHVDGHDVRDVTSASLRAQIGFVSQEVLLFNTSVRENIRLGKLDASDAEVVAAAQAAEIHDFIVALPEGYDTDAGVAGARFSGGERQRIALARALVRKPAILLLDEFSSALDVNTEAAIMETIVHLRGRCTIIAVTHRPSMAMKADRIIVLRDRRVVESGSHKELIVNTNGEYFSIWSTGGGSVPDLGQGIPA